MTLPRYPEYRSHETPWLGSLPAHWDGQALKRVVVKIESGVSVNAVDEPVAGASIGVLKTSCVYTGRFDPTENKAVVADELDRVACPVKAQTLIVSRMNTPALVGAAGLVAADAENLFLPDRLWQVHFAGALPVFVHYWTASPAYRAQVEMACAGTSSSMQNLSQDEFLRFALPLPPVSEQAAIAAFLDHEAAKIDGLIAEQERLIALLAEKRQATISHAVTRGLNPQAPLKDSGVPWLGEVPAHWEGKRMKRLVLSIEQGWSPQCENFPVESSEEWGVLKVGCVNGGVFNPAENKKLPPTLDPLQELALRKGDLLISRANTRELVGSAAVVGEDFDRLLLCDKLYRLRLDQTQANAEFVAAYLGTPEARSQIELDATGASSSMLNIGQAVVMELPIPCPDPVEQVQIVEALRSRTHGLDSLVAEAVGAVGLLRERRAALIAAAVTGQIDVRGFTAA